MSSIRDHRSSADYIDRTIATVRNHRDADNCWPQWANIFADEIEDLRVDVAFLVALVRIGFLVTENGERATADLVRHPATRDLLLTILQAKDAHAATAAVLADERMSTSVRSADQLARKPSSKEA